LRRETMTDEDREAVVKMAVACVLKYGTGYLNPLERLLPYWKATGLYDKGIMLRRTLLTETASKWKVKSALQRLDNIGELPPYDRDFFEGIVTAAAKTYQNGTYKRIEFCGRDHVRDFLASNIHGQPISFPVFKSHPGLNRSCNMPLLEVPPSGKLESLFFGVLCGAEAHKDSKGEIWARVRKECEPWLKKLGILYEADNRFVRINLFYIGLFFGELPEPIMAYWNRQMPPRGVEGTKMASLAAAMHWTLLFKRKKRQRYDLPYLLSSAHSWNVGVGTAAAEAEIERLRFDHVDARIRERCMRWAKLQEQTHKEENGEITWMTPETQE
jgi:hypothetical protein